MVCEALVTAGFVPKHYMSKRPKAPKVEYNYILGKIDSRYIEPKVEVKLWVLELRIISQTLNNDICKIIGPNL